MRNISKSVFLAAVVGLFAVGTAFANDKEALPAERIIAAIQTAVASNPGMIKEVEVERDKGQVIVKIKIIGSDGSKKKVKVNDKNEIMK